MAAGMEWVATSNFASLRASWPFRETSCNSCGGDFWKASAKGKPRKLAICATAAILLHSPRPQFSRHPAVKAFNTWISNKYTTSGEHRCSDAVAKYSTNRDLQLQNITFCVQINTARLSCLHWSSRPKVIKQICRGKRFENTGVQKSRHNSPLRSGL